LYDAKGEMRRVNCGDFTDQNQISNGCRFRIIPISQRSVEQDFKRKHWSDFAGVREAKTTEATTSG
jgi:hypothetical protein